MATGGLFYGELALRLWLVGDRTPPRAGTATPYRLLMEGEPMAAAAGFEKNHLPYEQAVALLHGDEQAQLGADAVAGKARRLMTARGFAVPRSRGRKTRQHPAGLTARQDEVLQLVADGMTDNEIADRLFLSPRTVQHHVSAILSKLDAPSRTEAASRAAAIGLLTSSATAGP